MTSANATYLALKIARQLYAKSPQLLTHEETARVNKVAARQRELEALILGTPEATSVHLPAATLAASLQEIRARYDSDEDYHADLDRNGLDDASLQRAVCRDLIVEAVLDRIAHRAAAVSATDIEIFYFMHRERFQRPETRALRHILITVNEALPGSERQQAEAKIAAIRARLLKEPARFAEQALKHSECPTAMNGGLLGSVPRGQLYAELDPVAFALAAGEVSLPVESELGFHLLRCDAIDAARVLTLAEARDSIRTHLEEARRSVCQKSWINALRREATAAPA